MNADPLKVSAGELRILETLKGFRQLQSDIGHTNLYGRWIAHLRSALKTIEDKPSNYFPVSVVVEDRAANSESTT